MISSIKVDRYRGLEHFEMNNLGRVNLLVGTNNSGKTSVLEALHLLTSRGDPMSLWQVLWRRGERVPGISNMRRPQAELDVSHLFTGHETRIGSKFTISAVNDTPHRSISFTIGEYHPKQRAERVADQDQLIPSRLVLQVSGNPTPSAGTIPLTRTLGISPDTFDTPTRNLRSRASEENPSQFITADSLDSEDLVSLWDKIALSQNEELVLTALRFLDPNIERVAAQATTQTYYGTAFRGGFIIKHRDYEQPIPIGSFGDGMWRMMAMAIAITQCSGGVLLVDEIDTGLHYTVMADMWKLIYSAAKALNVQIFATTHSYDCIRSLATLCASEATPKQPIFLHRIEAKKGKSIPYSEDEIAVAADRQLEVR